MNAFMRTATGADATSTRPGAGPLARVDVFDDLAAAEPIWRGLEERGAVSTPYQRYDFIAPWQRHVGARRGITPFLVVGTNARGSPLFLLPFGRSRRGPLGTAGWLGGKHANFNFGLWSREAMEHVGPAGIDAILEPVAAAAPNLDLLVLTNQPHSWDGMANPFAALPHQPSPSFGYRGSLTDDFEALAVARLSAPQRKKLRKKQRALAADGPVRYWRVETQDEADRVLDTFFA
jgi:CelD/BcsL family acetyltransferase involved in cellulose biosynthesis